MTIVAPTVGAGAQEQAPAEEDPQAWAEQRLADVQRRIEEAQQQAADAEAARAEANERVEELEQIVNEAAARLDAKQREVAYAEAELRRLEREHRELELELEERAVALYKRGTSLPFDAVLQSQNLDEAIDRTELLGQLSKSDAAALEDLTLSERAVREQQRVLEAKIAEVEKMKARQERLLAEATRLRDSKALEAATARSRAHALEAAKDQLAGDAQGLELLIAQNQISTTGAGMPSTEGYGWPLCGPVTSNFGRRWGRLHAGMDLDDTRSDAIMAAKDGVVISAGWGGGYGQLTLIDHGDGVVTAYAHQSQMLVNVGDTVVRGQVIGRVGNTGSSTGPHLHFETRVNGDPQDPRGFLPPVGC